MKKKLFLAILPFLSLTVKASAPTLPTKGLSINPVIGATTLNYATGTRKMINDASFLPTGDYTVEVKAKILSTAEKGLFLEIRDASRNGIRMAINSNGVDDYSALNYTNNTAITNVSADANYTATYHTFRFAVQGTNVYIYRDGVYVTTTTTQGIYKDNLLKDNNGDFESTDMSMWNFITAGQGRTTSTSEVRTGTGAVKLVNSGTTTVQSQLTIKGLKPNTTYGLSFYAKYLAKTTNNGNMRYELKLGGYDQTGTFVQTNSGNINNNIVSTPTNSTDPTKATWTLNVKQFTTGASDSVAVLDISGWNGNNTYVIDDMVLYETEATPTLSASVGSNLVTNGDFATDATGWPAAGWPLGAVAWSSAGGGQLQIKEASWVNRSNGTYSVPVTVSPNKTYTLSATTSQKIAATQYVQLTDGATTASTSYVSTGAFASTYNSTTPAFTTGPATTSLAMQFTTTTNSNTGSPVVVMTLDNVVLQEYTATFPSYLSYGKAFQSEADNFDIAYINYDLTGAYAPLNVATGIKILNNKMLVRNMNGTLIVSGVKAGERIEVYNCMGIKLAEVIAHDGENQLEIKNKGVVIVKSDNSTTKVIL